MHPNIVVLYTIMHTGTVFVREFLAKHPAIDGYLGKGETIAANGHYIRKDLEKDDSLETILCKITQAKKDIILVKDKERFHVIQHHMTIGERTETDWSLPFITCYAYLATFKRIYTIRDPLAAIISLFVRHQVNYSEYPEWEQKELEKQFVSHPRTFSEYYDLIRDFPGCIVRIDYPYKETEYREEMENVIKYIGIEKPDYFDEYVNGWNPSNRSPDSELKRLYLNRDYKGIKKMIPEIITEFEKYKEIYLDFLCGECNYPKDFFMWA